jgi:tetratricopeptide (TPR) repeat protein
VRALAEALAILGEGSPRRRVAALAQLDAVAAEEAADELAAAGIISAPEPLEMIHPLVCTAVLAELPEFVRQRARRRAAALLAAHGAPPARVCSQLLDVRCDSDPWVVSQLRAAATAALEQGEPAAAVSLLRRALEEPPAEGDRAEVLIELAHAEAAVGDPEALGRLERAVELLDDRRARGRAFYDLSRMLIPRGDYPAAASAARRGLAELDSDDPLAEDLMAAFVIAGTQHPRTDEELRPTVSRLFEGLANGRVPRRRDVCAWLASGVAIMGRPVEEVRPLVELALADDPLVDDRSHGMVFGLVGVALLISDDLDRLRAAASAAIAAAEDRGSLIGVGVATHWRAVVDYLRGRLQDAVQGAEFARELARSGWKGLIGWNIFYLARCYLELGELDRAAAAISFGLEVNDHPSGEALILEARGRLALQRGDDRAALQDFLASYAAIEGWPRCHSTVLRDMSVHNWWRRRGGSEPRCPTPRAAPRRPIRTTGQQRLYRPTSQRGHDFDVADPVSRWRFRTDPATPPRAPGCSLSVRHMRRTSNPPRTPLTVPRTCADRSDLRRAFVCFPRVAGPTASAPECPSYRRSRALGRSPIRLRAEERSARVKPRESSAGSWIQQPASGVAVLMSVGFDCLLREVVHRLSVR